MRAILEFDLPEDQHEHAYALAGTDALIAIEDVLNEIRSALRHGCGELTKFRDDDGSIHDSCEGTLELVRDFIIERKEYRNLPELV